MSDARIREGELLSEFIERAFGHLSPAQQLYHTQCIAGLVEEKVDRQLIEALGVEYGSPAEWPFGDITYDYYDESFEFKYCKEGWEPTPEQLAKCWALGFGRCWFCYGERGKPGYHEKAYAS